MIQNTRHSWEFWSLWWNSLRSVWHRFFNKQMQLFAEIRDYTNLQWIEYPNPSHLWFFIAQPLLSIEGAVLIRPCVCAYIPSMLSSSRVDVSMTDCSDWRRLTYLLADLISWHSGQKSKFTQTCTSLSCLYTIPLLKRSSAQSPTKTSFLFESFCRLWNCKSTCTAWSTCHNGL